MERQKLLEFEKQKIERERQRLMEKQLLEMEKQRQAERERLEREKEQERARQQELERQRAMERLREMAKGEEKGSPLRPRVLDLDSVSLENRHALPAQAAESGRLKPLSPRAEEPYRPAILDIDSFRTQMQPAPHGESFPTAGFGEPAPGAGVRSQPHTPELEGVRGPGPGRGAGRPSPVWTPSQLEFWEQRESGALDVPLTPSRVGAGWAAPEPPQKPAGKPSLEQLLQRQEERQAGPERRWSGLPAEASSPTAWTPSPRRETTAPGGPESQRQGFDPADSLWWLQDPAPMAAPERREEVGDRWKTQGSQAKDVSRMRSRSVSRRSAPAESPLEGPLSRMRSRSAHRERGRQSWEQLKQCVSADEEGRDTDTLVHETDSQYGTWDTGLRTDDSLTPATPTSDSNLSSSPRKPTPPHTPGEPTTPSDLDTPDAPSPAPPNGDRAPPFVCVCACMLCPQTSTTLLDSSALRSRVQLSKKRSRRNLPSRAARHSAALSVLQEGPGVTADDWMYRDSTEEKVESSKQEDSDTEDQPRGAETRPAASQPQRVALFPGMDPSALKAQLKKRGDSDNQTEGASPSATQLSRSPKSPFLPRASRVLPPAGGKENGEESSPQWLKELKSKKRLSQYDNDT
ncbi:uncharacterized protein KIAA1671-like [Megalops cyprinoides]|uniref:uncharacterized protein KIAA1671-like n=1 Tax=Megalops cyprinoides TaxID=118141 RepID=UPI00186475D6|nr:uncharacterized protein KIAA1671-like [Megalops cyprinoides]